MTEHDHSHHAHQGIDRRGLLAAGAGGLLVLATPGTAFAGTSRTSRAETGTTATVGAGPAALTGAARASAITAGTALVHADPHNHTVMSVPLDVAMGNWVVLRVSDPTRPNPSPGPNGHPCNDFGLAYSSPWWLQPWPRGRNRSWHVSGISRTAERPTVLQVANQPGAGHERL